MRFSTGRSSSLGLLGVPAACVESVEPLLVVDAGAVPVVVEFAPAVVVVEFVLSVDVEPGARFNVGFPLSGGVCELSSEPLGVDVLARFSSTGRPGVGFTPPR